MAMNGYNNFKEELEKLKHNIKSKDYYIEKLANGIEYQDKVCIELSKYNLVLQNINSKKFQYSVGENLQGFEIKQDRTSIKTNRYSIEIAEKTNGKNNKWIDSGIFRNDNSFMYIQGNDEFFHIFAKKHLILIYEKYKNNINFIDEYPKDNPTVKKFYLDFKDADRYCAIKIFFDSKKIAI